MKEPTNLFLAGILIIIICLVIDWIFINILFKKYQLKVPSIWRQKTSRSYFAIIFSSLLFTCLFLLFYTVFKNNLDHGQIFFTIIFGILIWLGFYFPSFRPNNTPVLKIDNKAVLSLVLGSITKVLTAALIVIFLF